MKIALRIALIFALFILLTAAGMMITYAQLQQIRSTHAVIDEEWQELTTNLTYINEIDDLIQSTSLPHERTTELLKEKVSLLDKLISACEDKLSQKETGTSSHHESERKQFTLLKQEAMGLKRSIEELGSAGEGGFAQIIIHLHLIEKQLNLLQMTDIRAMETAIITSSHNQDNVFRSIWLIFTTILAALTLCAVLALIYIQAVSRKFILNEKLATAGLMSQMLAHEIRNPLGIIKSSASILKNGAASSSQKEELTGYLLEECDRIDGLIAQLVLLKSSGDKPMENISLEDILKPVMTVLTPAAHKAGVTLQAQYPQAAVKLRCDPGELKQVLLNIILNAIQASKPGGRIDIILDAGQQHTRIVVRDTGSGINPSIRKHLFEAFVTTKATGTGLGLVIAQQIIERYHGKITIVSRPNQGTTVTITLPQNS